MEVIACVSRVVSKVVDRITGDRVEVPLLVAAASVEALKNFGITAQIMYGPAAWIEVFPDHSVAWAGCWGEHFTFWAATQFGEVVDLNVSVAHRKPSHDKTLAAAIYSPPMLWSLDVPAFYRYRPEGIAELELHDERDRKHYELVLREVQEKCQPAQIAGKEPEFPNEPILCPGRRLLDDSQGTFKQFDRALSVRGIPVSPL